PPGTGRGPGQPPGAQGRGKAGPGPPVGARPGGPARQLVGRGVGHERAPGGHPLPAGPTGGAVVQEGRVEKQKAPESSGAPISYARLCECVRKTANWLALRLQRAFNYEVTNVLQILHYL